MPQLDTIMYSSIIFFLWIFLLIFTEIIFLFLKYLYTMMRTKTLYLRNLYILSSKTFQASKDMEYLVSKHADVLAKQLTIYLDVQKEFLEEEEKKYQAIVAKIGLKTRKRYGNIK